MTVTRQSNAANSPVGSDLANALCVKCGYALAGLQESGICPECGESIEDSFVRWLEGVGDETLHGVRRGTRMLFWLPPMLLAAWVLLEISGTQRFHWNHGRFASGVFGVSYAMILVTAGLLAIGFWKVTGELEGAPDWVGLSWRRVTSRACPAIFSIATSLLPLWLIVGVGSEVVQRLLFLVSIAAALAAFGLLWTFGEYLACVGTSLRELDLARESKIGHRLAFIASICGLISVAGVVAGRAWAIAGILVLPGLAAVFFSCLSLGFANVTLWSRIEEELDRRRKKVKRWYEDPTRL